MNSESEFTHARRLQQFYNALVLKAPLDGGLRGHQFQDSIIFI